MVEPFTPTFGFEFGVVRLQNELFRPLQDADKRWFDHCSEVYEWLGTRFRILYALKDGRYAFLTYSCCLGREERHDGRPLQIWRSECPPEGGIIAPEQAVAFLLRGHQEIPFNLQEALQRVLHPAAPPVRPLSHWERKGLLTRRSSAFAHEQDVLLLADQIQAELIRLVQEIHAWPDNPVLRRHDAGRAVEILLFQTYAVDPARWWGPSTVIPPETVDLVHLRWPRDSLAATELLVTLQRDLEAPLLALTYLWPHGHPDRPTQEENRLISQELRASLPKLEQQVLKLRQALARLRAAQANEPPKLAGKPLKEPTEDEFRLYLLSTTMNLPQSKILPEPSHIQIADS